MSTTAGSTPENSVVNGIRVALGVSGIASLVFGAIIVFWPTKSAEVVAGALAILLGIYAVVAGLVYLGLGIFAKTGTAWNRIGNLLLGVVFIAAGIITFSNLGAASASLVLLLGILIGIVWIAEGVIAFTTLHETASKGWAIFYAIISVLAGIWLIITPIFGVVFLWWFTGFSLVVLGVVQIVRAFTVGRHA